ncbi:MAG: MFS transporter, partial [Halobacteria archaeon]|nr:MFS transporter [Halobacteria archaeon]
MAWLDRDDPSVRYVAASLIAGVFFGGLAGGVAFPTLPQLGVLLGISPLLVGVILSINRFTRLLMSTPAGQILDRIGTRRPMIVGFFVQALAPFGYALALHAPEFNVPSSSVFLISRALWGIGSAFVFVGAFSTITHITTQENRGKWIGYMRGGQSLGFPTGLVAGGLITDVYGFEIAFLTAGVAGMFSALVAFAVLPDISPDVGATSRLREIPSIIQADPRVFTIGTVNFIVRFLFAGVLLSTVVLFAGANNINIGTMSETGVSGIVMAISVVFASVTTVFVGRKSDSLSNRAYVTIPALGLLAAGFAVLSVFPTLPGTLLGVGMIGVGVGGTNPPLVAFLGDISPSSDVGKMGGV